MTAYKFQPASNNPYLQLTQTDYLLMSAVPNEEDLDNDLGINNDNSQDSNNSYLRGNTETVLDLIEQNYSNPNPTLAQMAAAATTKNTQVLSETGYSSNVFSRKQNQSHQS